MKKKLCFNLLFVVSLLLSDDVIDKVLHHLTLSPTHHCHVIEDDNITKRYL